MLKKAFILSTLLSCLLVIFFIPVHAYMPSPFLVINVVYDEIPQNTVYIDLLIPIHCNDSDFISKKEEPHIVQNIFRDEILEINRNSEIAYFDDGYYSYLFHFKDSTIIPSSATGNKNMLRIEYGSNHRLLDKIVDCKNCKFAFVDGDGNILEITDNFTIKDFFFRDLKKIVVESTSVYVSYQVNPYRIVFAILLFFLFLFLFCISILIYKKGVKHRERSA